MRVVRLADVDLAHALGEGEGYTSVAEWRAGHEEFFHSAEMRAALDDPDFTVDDDTLLVAEEFRRCVTASRLRRAPGDRAQPSRTARSRPRSPAMDLRTWRAITGVAQPKNRPGVPTAWMATSVPSGASCSS